MPIVNTTEYTPDFLDEAGAEEGRIPTPPAGIQRGWGRRSDEMIDRGYDIIERRLAGETLASIGKSYGVCVETVRQQLRFYELTIHRSFPRLRGGREAIRGVFFQCGIDVT